MVDLKPFWDAMRMIEAENSQINAYRNAVTFWETYEANLTGSRQRIEELRQEIKLNGQWTGAAATAFDDRINAGVASIQKWLDSGPAAVRDRFRDLVDRLPNDYLVLDANRRWLLSTEKVVPTLLGSERAKIVDQERWVRIPTENVGNVVESVRSVVENAQQRQTELAELFGQIRTQLTTLPDDTQTWAGPTTTTAPPAVPPAGPGGPNTAAAGPGGPGAGPGGPGAGPGAPGAGPGGPGAGPGAAAPGGPGAGPDAAAGPSASDPGAEQPGADQPGAETPTGLGPATEGPGDPGATVPPPTDPSLAGLPTATAPPTTSLPGSGTSPLPGSVAGIPTGNGPGTNSPLPLTPFGSSPLPQSSPVARGGESPGTRGSTVDGPRGGVPVGGAPGAGQSPVARGGLVSSGAGPGSGHGPGFYPPMVPPMFPGAGGNNAGGIKPGEADFAGGPIRQRGGRESWRAGLRPQLLGRAGDHDDEPRHLPPERPPADDVLDEELWQVPDAAPVAPPESPPQRGQLWGPG